MSLRTPIHRVIVLTADFQAVGTEDACNVDIIAQPTNSGTAYIEGSGESDDFPLIPGQIQDYAKDGASRVNLSSVMVRGTVGDKVFVKAEGGVEWPDSSVRA